MSVSSQSFRPVALMGMPRSGKSTLSKRLKPEWHVVDSDKALTQWLKSTPDQIIQERGINVFRELEKQWLTDSCLPTLKQYPNYLLSTGGGMPCIPGVLDDIKKHFFTIYLYLPKANWLKRMNDPRQAPHALAKQYNLAELETLYDTRQQYYQQAHAKLEIAHTPTKDAKALQNLINANLHV